MLAKLSRFFYCVFLSFLLLQPAFAAERGTFGFEVSVNADGILSPTLIWAKIAKIKPASPAEKAGMKVGDEIVEVEGHTVAGAKASLITPLMKKDVGQILNLKVKRGTDTIPLQLTAAPVGN